MKRLVYGLVFFAFAFAAVAGCGTDPAAPSARAKTGAEAVAKSYFEALVRKDWPGAYKTLSAESKASCGSDQFAKLAEKQLGGLGFEPSEVRLHSCDERTDEAIAHASLKGRVGSSQRFRKQTVALRREGGTWAVVLPSAFGRSKPPKK